MNKHHDESIAEAAKAFLRNRWTLLLLAAFYIPAGIIFGRTHLPESVLATHELIGFFFVCLGASVLLLAPKKKQ